MIARLIQMEVTPGQPGINLRRMLTHVADARRDGVRLLVFPEMAIPGYLLGDRWEQTSFLRDCEACGEDLRQASAGMTLIFGNVAMDWNRRNEDGRIRKYNACFVAEDQHWIGPERGPCPFVIKTLLPNYREFDDSRYFFDLRRLAQEEHRAVADCLRPVPTAAGRLGCLLCEDAWDADYPLSPLNMLKAQGADVFVNISASPFTLNKNLKRHRVFSRHAEALGRPLLYVNHVGIQNNGKTLFTFDGASCVYDGHGGHMACNTRFKEDTLTFDLAAPTPPGGHSPPPTEDGPAILSAALTYGTNRFMQACGVEQVVVGASGGIDSAVVAALYATFLPPEALTLVNMPSRFNSATTRHLARTLAGNLGCHYAEVPIENSIKESIRQLDGLGIGPIDRPPARTLALTGPTLENVQARDRSSRILAAIAAALGGVFTCNANKSEMTVGYTTLYGDLGGYLAGIADLWKTEVYALGRHLNTAVFGRDVIPEGSFTVIPSAELSADQDVNQGKGDPLIYPYHDRVFAAWVERWNRATPEELLAAYAGNRLEDEIGYEGRVADLFPTAASFIADLERWWNLHQGMGLAKRIQAPPVLAIKRRAYGFDLREAQLGPHYTRRYLAMKATLLVRPGPS